MNVLEGSRGFLSYSEVQALSSPFRLCLCSLALSPFGTFRVPVVDLK